MGDLRAMLSRAALDAAPLDLDEIRGQVRRRRRNRRIALGMSVVAIVTIIGGAMRFGSKESPRQESDVATTPDVTETPSPSAGDPVRLAIEATSVAAADGRVWAITGTADGTEHTQVVEIDPSSGEATPLAVINRHANWIAAGNDLVWLGTPADGVDPVGHLTVLDANDGSVIDSLDEGAYAIAFAGDEAWVSVPTKDEVLAIDVRLDRNLDVKRIKVGRQPTNLAVTPQGDLWVTESSSRSIAKIDRTSLTVSARVDWPGTLYATGNVGLWAWEVGSQALVEVDPAAPTVPINSVPVPDTPAAVVASDGGDLWVGGSAGIQHWSSGRATGDADASVTARDVYRLAVVGGTVFYVPGGGGGGLWKWRPFERAAETAKAG